MSLFDRISNLAKASIHEVLDKLEDPVLMTGQYLRNLEDDLNTAEKMLKEQQMTVNIQERKSADIAHLAKQCEVRALTALQDGDETTARHAAAEKLRYEEQAQQYAAEAKDARDRVAELEIRLKEGKEEFTRLKEKRSELAARARKVNDRAVIERPNISYGIKNGAAARGFERMEEKILEWEASKQVSGSIYGFQAENDAKRAEIDAELNRLNSKLADSSKADA